MVDGLVLTQLPILNPCVLSFTCANGFLLYFSMYPGDLAPCMYWCTQSQSQWDLLMAYPTWMVKKENE